jgi:LL-diaminopimelate aminotransferase
MDKTGVICTPGNSFGSMGEGYVRFALVLPVETINEMLVVIDNSGILKK